MCILSMGLSKQFGWMCSTCIRNVGYRECGIGRWGLWMMVVYRDRGNNLLKYQLKLHWIKIKA